MVHHVTTNDSECQRVVQRMATSDKTTNNNEWYNEWQQVRTSGTASENKWYYKWQQMTTSNSKWQRVIKQMNTNESK